MYIPIFSRISGILSPELIEKCGRNLPFDQNNELHKIFVANNIVTSQTEDDECLLEGSWSSMVTVYNELSKFLQVNFCTKSNFLTFNEEQTDLHISTVSPSLACFDNDSLVDTVKHSDDDVLKKHTKHKVPEPIVYFNNDNGLSIKDKSKLEAVSDKVAEYIKQQTLEKEKDASYNGNDVNSPKIKEESQETIDSNVTAENCKEIKEKQKIQTECEEPRMKTRQRKSLSPKKSMTSTNKRQNCRKNVVEKEQDKQTQKKPSSIKPKKSWSQKNLQGESKSMNSSDETSDKNENNKLLAKHYQSSREVEEEAELIINKGSDVEWTPEDKEYSQVKGKSLKVGMKKKPRKKGDKRRKQLPTSADSNEEDEDCYSCQDCSYVSNKKMNLREHIQRMHKDKIWSCDFCSKIFSIQKDLLRHEKSHMDPQLCCDYCGKMYKTRRTFINHKKSHEENYIKPEYECNTCKKSFSTKYVLNYHVKSEHLGMKKQFLCPTCGKSFTQKNSYVQHANVHMGLKPYQCEHCGKSFAYEKSLKEHRFMHDEVLHFKCDVCEKLFRQKSALQIHKKIHKITKDHLCGVCGKGFTQRQALLRHERIHNGDKPFSCAVCSRTFSDASIIRRHMILVHKKNSKEWREDVICDLKGADDYWIEGKKPEGRIKRLPAGKKPNREVEEGLSENNQINENNNLTTHITSSHVVGEIIDLDMNRPPTEEHNILSRDSIESSPTENGFMGQTMFSVSEEHIMKETALYVQKNPPMLPANTEAADIILNASNIHVSQYLQNPHVSADTGNSLNLDHTFTENFTNLHERKADTHSYQTNVATVGQWTAEPYPFNTMQYIPHFSNYPNQ